MYDLIGTFIIVVLGSIVVGVFIEYKDQNDAKYTRKKRPYSTGQNFLYSFLTFATIAAFIWAFIFAAKFLTM